MDVRRLVSASTRYAHLLPKLQMDLESLQRLFARPDLVWLKIIRDVMELVVAVRVRHGLRRPDALEAASCCSRVNATRYTLAAPRLSGWRVCWALC